MGATEILPDDATLRVARRSRVLDAMDAADIDLLVVGREANARYVSGVRRLWTAGSRAFGPGCVLVRESGAVHLLSTWDEGVPDDIPRANLYGISFNSESFLRVLRGIEGASTARTVATDALTPSAARMLANAFPVAEIVDGEQMLRRARSVKMAAEVDAIRSSVRIAERALRSATDQLATGITERELTGVFMEAMALQGVTTPATQDVAWITSREHSWHRAGRDVPVTAGDLVAFDAGVVNDGYFGEIGRTVLVGDAASNPGAAALLRCRDELLERLLVACRPGARSSALLDAYESAGIAAPPVPVARGLGLGFDVPLVTHALADTARDQRLEPGMVFGVSAFVWRHGVGAASAQEPIVMTDTGPEVLSSTPVLSSDEPTRPRTATEEPTL